MHEFPIHTVMETLKIKLTGYELPVVDAMAKAPNHPFRVLIATILSLRTKDTLTGQVAPRLFAIADTPQAMLELSEERLVELIYPVGFYRNKARAIRRICAILIEQYNGEVPADLDALLQLPGVGRKTANLVMTAGYELPGICVDTHVHRITNRWGYVQTKAPDETELVLRAKLPAEYWIPINGLLVMHGQNICHPTSPKCSICPVEAWCARIGVQRSR
ncbi:MAG: endonuclease III [Chloroflexaceae bacterium]|nr:endonuclease III [Chloroflexaceae bacterium]